MAAHQIIGSNPQQMKLPFALWTPFPAIKAIGQAQFGLDMQDRLIGKYLALGFYRPCGRRAPWSNARRMCRVSATYPRSARAHIEGVALIVLGLGPARKMRDWYVASPRKVHAGAQALPRAHCWRKASS
ncbi:MAG: hypothetical protein IPN75_09785 [Dechloromonas sp.]|uniref:Uncharacterized protein n=1 Tax=Candidatus Dechloromonas phosphorivorans TaxID=2899244 RepID=A0A9D7QHU2_9RHOO|nr:hypothetical protein [Candidatus Dechloromonas phosphorivorans]